MKSELLKNADEEVKKIIYEKIQDCYITGNIPNNFTISKLVTIPKKGNATECANYRTLSLISHTSKILLNIIKNRIKNKVENNVDDDQFGFRLGKGIREALLALRILLERRIDMNRSTYIAFVDIEKAFDNVNWKRLFKTMRQIGIDWRDRRIIFQLYKQQKTQIEIKDVKKCALIRKGVRQGCSVSPLLFNIFIESAIKTFKERTKGVKVNGRQIHSMRFANDIAIVAESERDLSNMLTNLSIALEQVQLKINAKKTKILIVDKNGKEMQRTVNLHGTPIEEVKSFCYLGNHITQDNKYTTEIKRRIALAKQAFIKKQNLLTSRHLQIKIRKLFIKTYVWSVALYGSESWTLSTLDKKRIEAFEMWTWRKIMKISWRERKSNTEVLNLIKEPRQIIRMMEIRKTKFFGHIMRHNTLITNIMEGKINGKRGRGRPRETNLGNLKKLLSLASYEDMKRLADNREDWLKQQGQAFRQ